MVVKKLFRHSCRMMLLTLLVLAAMRLDASIEYLGRIGGTVTRSGQLTNEDMVGGQVHDRYCFVAKGDGKFEITSFTVTSGSAWLHSYSTASTSIKWLIPDGSLDNFNADTKFIYDAAIKGGSVQKGYGYVIDVYHVSSGGSYSFTAKLPGSGDDNPPVVKTVTALSISGAPSVTSGDGGSYACTAYYSDGSSSNVSPTWAIESGTSYASVSSSGWLTAYTVTSSRTVTLKASYGGKSTTKPITINPQGGQSDNVMVTFNGNGGIVYNLAGQAVGSSIRLEQTLGANWRNLPDATNGNKTFDGWWTQSSGGTRISTFDTFSGTPTTVYAHWKVAATVDLTFVQASGWKDKLVVSTVTGTTTDATSFTTGDKLYLDFSVKNVGDDHTSSSVYVDIYVDGVKVGCWLRAAGLDAGESYAWSDRPLDALSAGMHEIKIQIRNDASETVIGNNIYKKSVFVSQQDVRTVTYNPGEYGIGEIVSDKVDSLVGVKLREAIFTRDGYRQMGWSTRENDSFPYKIGLGKGQIPPERYELGEQIHPSAGLVLYPSWMTITYDIRFLSGQGSVTMLQQGCESGRVYSLAICTFPPPTGKRFAGWACSNGRRYDDGVLVFDLAEPGETVTMTAIWE